MKKLKRKLKRALTPYHIATTICLIVLITSLCIILKPETKKTPSGITVVSSKTKENEEITEEEAKELAIKQFKKIGEKNLEKDKINIIKKGTLYKIPFSVLFILTEHQWLRSYNRHLLCMKDIHYSRLYHLRNNSPHNCFRQR